MLRLVRTWVAFVFIPVALVLGGCGSSPDGEQSLEDQEFLQQYISSFSDRTGFYDSFQAEFATGSAPSEQEMEAYQKYEFYPRIGDISISGSTCTAVVRVTDPNNEDALIGTPTWTLVKENDVWKIQDAPLP